MCPEIFIASIGQDSHRYIDVSSARTASDANKQIEEVGKTLVLGGVEFPDLPGFIANSDGDVILHAICNAISGLTGKPVLGSRADELCKAGYKDSRKYLELALADLAADSRTFTLHHLSISIEGKRPKFAPIQAEICRSVAKLLGLKEDNVCLTATSGEDLSSFGRGEGLNCICLLSASYLAK